MQPAPAPHPDLRRTLGVDLFNHVWALLEKPERSPAEYTAQAKAAAEAIAHDEDRRQLESDPASLPTI
jgi:hypothetical protein